MHMVGSTGAAGYKYKICGVNSRSVQKGQDMVSTVIRPLPIFWQGRCFGDAISFHPLRNCGESYRGIPHPYRNLSVEQLQGLQELRVTTALELFDGEGVLGLRKHRRGSRCQCNHDIRRYSLVPNDLARWCKPFFNGE
jgi:hypothetical protein